MMFMIWYDSLSLSLHRPLQEFSQRLKGEWYDLTIKSYFDKNPRSGPECSTFTFQVWADDSKKLLRNVPNLSPHVISCLKSRPSCPFLKWLGPCPWTWPPWPSKVLTPRWLWYGAEAELPQPIAGQVGRRHHGNENCWSGNNSLLYRIYTCDECVCATKKP